VIRRLKAEAEAWKVYFFRVENVKNIVEEIFSRLGWKNDIGRNDVVLLKPNFLMAPKAGVTTSLELVRAVVEVVKDRTSQVYVGETDSTAKDFDRIARRLDLGCKVVNLSRDKTVIVSGKYGVYRLPELALKTKIINLPMLKTHVLTKVSLGVKNLFGLIQEKYKIVYHWKLDRILYDLYHIFRPPMNILDALYVLDEKGPVKGRIRKASMLAASSDTLTLDAAACRLIGLEPSKVSHLKKLMATRKIEYEVVGEAKLGMEFKIPATGLIKIGDFTLTPLRIVKKKLFRLS